MTEASTLDAPATPGPQPAKRRIDPARGRRVQPRGPGPPELALRFTDRERGDLPTVRLQPRRVTLLERFAGGGVDAHQPEPGSSQPVAASAEGPAGG